MKRGSITVYLTLVFSILLSMIVVLITGARDSVIRMKTEVAMDASFYSVFAEYNRELLDRFDLLFIDTSYGGNQGSIHNTEAHLKDYMNLNFTPVKDISMFGTKDLLALTATNVEITDYSLATDEKGGIFERQAVDYVKEKYGLNAVRDLNSMFQSAKDQNLLTTDITQMQCENQSQIDSMEKPKRKVGKDEWEEVPLDNPADSVNGNRRIGILSMVLDENKELSNAAIALSNYVSNRKCEQGTGYGERKELSSSQKLLFDQYIMEKAGCYTETKENSLLQYEKEYILSGKENDPDNLKSVAEKLLFMRQAANFIYLYKDAAKVAEAEALALSLTVVALSPEFLEPVKNSILLAWIFAESVYDVKHLLEGGKIPLMKTAETWHFSLSQMLQFRNNLTSTEVSENEIGLTYEEYLGILLFSENHEKKVSRMMDIIEMDVRNTAGNRKFRMDTCVDYIEAEAVVESKYGYGCEINRSYFYY